MQVQRLWGEKNPSVTSLGTDTRNEIGARRTPIMESDGWLPFLTSPVRFTDPKGLELRKPGMRGGRVQGAGRRVPFSLLKDF